MELKKEEELLALGAALYLVGIEVEASRERLEELFDQGHPLCSEEILAEQSAFDRLSRRFMELEERFLALEEVVRTDPIFC